MRLSHNRIAWEMIQVQNVFRNVAESHAYVHSFNQTGIHGSNAGRDPGPPPAVLVNAHAAQEIAESLTEHASNMRQSLAKARDAEEAFTGQTLRGEIPSAQDTTISPVRIKAYSFNAKYSRTIRKGDFFQTRPSVPGKVTPSCIECSDMYEHVVRATVAQGTRFRMIFLLGQLCRSAQS